MSVSENAPHVLREDSKRRTVAATSEKVTEVFARRLRASLRDRRRTQSEPRDELPSTSLLRPKRADSAERAIPSDSGQRKLTPRGGIPCIRTHTNTVDSHRSGQNAQKGTCKERLTFAPGSRTSTPTGCAPGTQVAADCQHNTAVGLRNSARRRQATPERRAVMTGRKMPWEGKPNWEAKGNSCCERHKAGTIPAIPARKAGRHKCRMTSTTPRLEAADDGGIRNSKQDSKPVVPKLVPPPLTGPMFRQSRDVDCGLTTLVSSEKSDSLPPKEPKVETESIPVWSPHKKTPSVDATSTNASLPNTARLRELGTSVPSTSRTQDMHTGANAGVLLPPEEVDKLVDAAVPVPEVRHGMEELPSAPPAIRDISSNAATQECKVLDAVCADTPDKEVAVDHSKCGIDTDDVNAVDNFQLTPLAAMQVDLCSPCESPGDARVRTDDGVLRRVREEILQLTCRVSDLEEGDSVHALEKSFDIVNSVSRTQHEDTAHSLVDALRAELKKAEEQLLRTPVRSVAPATCSEKPLENSCKKDELDESDLEFKLQCTEDAQRDRDEAHLNEIMRLEASHSRELEHLHLEMQERTAACEKKLMDDAVRWKEEMSRHTAKCAREIEEIRLRYEGDKDKRIAMSSAVAEDKLAGELAAQRQLNEQLQASIARRSDELKTAVAKCSAQYAGGNSSMIAHNASRWSQEMAECIAGIESDMETSRHTTAGAKSSGGLSSRPRHTPSGEVEITANIKREAREQMQVELNEKVKGDIQQGGK